MRWYLKSEVNYHYVKSLATRHGLLFDFRDSVPGDMGSKERGFVCIEPWCGIADGV